MDNKEFKRSSYQRVYQYLRRYSAGKNLDNFSFVGAEEEGSAEDCLELFLEWVRLGWLYDTNLIPLLSLLHT